MVFTTAVAPRVCGRSSVIFGGVVFITRSQTGRVFIFARSPLVDLWGHGRSRVILFRRVATTHIRGAGFRPAASALVDGRASTASTIGARWDGRPAPGRFGRSFGEVDDSSARCWRHPGSAEAGARPGFRRIHGLFASAGALVFFGGTRAPFSRARRRPNPSTAGVSLHGRGLWGVALPVLPGRRSREQEALRTVIVEVSCFCEGVIPDGSRARAIS